ncbi:MAG: serine hydrolase [Thermodesulfobacteriota bacterium]
MLSKILLTILATSLLLAGSAFAFQPVQSQSSVSDMIGNVGKRGGVLLAPNARPATSDAQTRPRVIQTVAPPPTRAARPALPPWIDQPKSLAVGPRRSSEKPETGRVASLSHAPSPVQSNGGPRAVPGGIDKLLGAPLPIAEVRGKGHEEPSIQAKALLCMDCSSNRVLLARNDKEPLPIASITKLMSAMTVLDAMSLDQVVETPKDITEVEPKKVGIQPGDRFTVRDLLHGMLIVSGNDCAEVLARAYPHGGRNGFIQAMNKKAAKLGARQSAFFTPSGLDMRVTLGRKDGKILESKHLNAASAEEVALIAKHAFEYSAIRQIVGTKTYAMKTVNQKPRTYRLKSNDRLLFEPVPLAGAKTGFTNKAGKCIVALFNDKAKDYLVVVLNSPQHFKAAEKLYRWATGAF